MILVFGGAYQGKLDYVMERFDLGEADIYRCNEKNSEKPDGKRVIYELDKWILAKLIEKTYNEEDVNAFIRNLNEEIVICNDISCGIVPMEPIQRAWREAVGRAMATLSKRGDEVIRLYCAIATKLK